jgi:hypothetical protein
VHGRRRRQRDLGGNGGGIAQEDELIERERLPAAHRRRRIGRGEVDLVAVVVAKLEQRRTHLQTLGALDESTPIGAAAKLAVGDDLEPDVLLHADGITDTLVLNLRELVVRDLAAGVAPERLAQRRGPQQASHMVGAKRRAAVWADGHRVAPPGRSDVTYRSIGRT